jgi:hypothetical protein
MDNGIKGHTTEEVYPLEYRFSSDYIKNDKWSLWLNYKTPQERLEALRKLPKKFPGVFDFRYGKGNQGANRAPGVKLKPSPFRSQWVGY